MVLQTGVMNYGGNGTVMSLPIKKEATKQPSTNGTAKASSDGEPDFRKMTPAQKIAFHKARWDRILG